LQSEPCLGIGTSLPVQRSYPISSLPTPCPKPEKDLFGINAGGPFPSPFPLFGPLERILLGRCLAGFSYEPVFPLYETILFALASSLLCLLTFRPPYRTNGLSPQPYRATPVFCLSSCFFGPLREINLSFGSLFSLVSRQLSLLSFYNRGVATFPFVGRTPFSEVPFFCLLKSPPSFS